jgi:hypothetical protein
MESKRKTLTLKETIASLEDEIETYKTLFNKAIAEGNEKDKHLYGDLISKRAANLQVKEQLLLQQKEIHLQQQRRQQERKISGNVISAVTIEDQLHAVIAQQQSMMAQQQSMMAQQQGMMAQQQGS